MDSLEALQRDRPVEITPAMIEAGVSILRREFGGETEGQNRFVDFRDVVTELLALSQSCSIACAPSDLKTQTCYIR